MSRLTSKQLELAIDPKKLYLVFHRPTSLVGSLIALWTLGNYSHCEFLYDGVIYCTNPSGVSSKPWVAIS